MKNVASFSPSKSFFVEMLTRDIELQDAILDLVDNCIDGIQRRLKASPKKGAQPYSGFKAKLDLSKKGFTIEDNCGGIPRDKAENYAFRLGRPSNAAPEKIPTVGVYGIGMKRAIFKLGRSATVTTLHQQAGFSVSISAAWMVDDDDWDIPITNLAKTAVPVSLRSQGGTIISVANLLPTVQYEFDSQRSSFIDALKATIATHYSYILQKGFAIEVNGVAVKPRMLGLLVSKPKASGARIEPFVYRATKDEVEVEIVLGLYRDIPDQAEIDEELEGRASASRETCGWTIICNERVVVYADKTRLTGWGEATVPAYHPQFNAIAGIVRFTSNDMSKLPVTTTKRGLEASSELFLTVKDVMREGLKHFTNFTNQWKGRAAERNAILVAAESIDAFESAALLKSKAWSTVRKGLGGTKYVPQLPKPVEAKESSDILIKFSRPAARIEFMADLLFDDVKADPNSVGGELFDQAYMRAKR